MLYFLCFTFSLENSFPFLLKIILVNVLFHNLEDNAFRESDFLQNRSDNIFVLISRMTASVRLYSYSHNLHLLSTNIYDSRFDFFFSSFSLECESPYVSSSQLALLQCECLPSAVSDSPFYELVGRRCSNSNLQLINNS